MTPPILPPRSARTAAALAAGLCLGLAVSLGGCEPTVGQTGIILALSSQAPMDCVLLVARRPGGPEVRKEIDDLPPSALERWDDFSFRALVYSGGELGEGSIDVRATGHRSGCATAPVSEGAAQISFVRGVVKETELVLRFVGTDADDDGYSDETDCAPADPLIFPRRTTESDRECDGVDNNCNAVVDENCPCETARPCHPLGLQHPAAGAGSCSLGRQACDAGRLSTLCVGAVLPATESCDGVDTDCDGLLDPASCPCADGNTRSCYTAGPPGAAGKGACAMGVQTCREGVYGACVGSVAPTREQCNGVDDDCDGVKDNPDTLEVPLCEKQDGVCAGSRRACTASGPAASCAATDYERTAQRRGLRYRATEDSTLCDGVDNDCDGRIDEECSCAPGTVESCHPLGAGTPAGAIGECRRGTRTCLADARWGPCEGAVAPVEEECNGRDDDCDGLSDEDAPGTGAACETGRPGVCAQGEKRCVDGALACVARRSPAATESCDGADDDCDGLVDEGFDKQNDPAHCGGPFECGACAEGQDCCGGRCASTRSDALNCGACGAACADGSACCGSSCRDLQADPLNCGACGEVCAAGRTCRRGGCVLPAEQACADAQDDDRDGLVDCADTDCAEGTACEVGAAGTLRVCRRSLCVPKAEAKCDDRLDDDLDGFVDCEDTDCPVNARCGVESGFQKVCRTPAATAPEPAPRGRCVVASEQACANGEDDDLDGKADCADGDCPTGTACDDRGGTCARLACRHETACKDRTDDDGDGLIDCEDTRDCTDGTACDESGGTCAQGRCRHELVAQCGDGLDNDLDGASDCSDGDCPDGTACAGTGTCCTVQGQRTCAKELSCTDGADNDCDQKVDCSDPDCPGCTGGTTCCGGACRNLQTDPANCRTCGASCDDANACTTDTCSGGACAHAKVANRAQATGCNGAKLCCNGTCVDGVEKGAACVDGLDNDCDGLADCNDPDCPCAAGSACCGGTCRDVAGDPDNCATCGNRCTSTNPCQQAACTGGACTLTPKADRTACGAGAVCCGGACTGATEPAAACNDGADNDCDGLVDCQDPDCPASGRTWCAGAGRCLDLVSDDANCGACGLACAAGENCHQGACRRETTGDPGTPPGFCGDTLDNDGDGLRDCGDPDCTDGTTCGTEKVCCGGTCKAEICTNGIDDDCDGLPDCDDPDCSNDLCNDGNACTAGERCTAPGVCGGGTPGVCDQPPGPCAEPLGTCDPSSGTCSYAFKAAGTACRAAAGECDVVEYCTGSSFSCPADAKVAANTACTDDGNACTKDVCNGTATSCQHPAGNAGATCRGAAGECDVAEVCSGSSTSCPADAKKALNTSCTSDGLDCTLDICNGTLATCTHPTAPAATVCRTSGGACDLQETCDGTATTCPADEKRPATHTCRAAAAGGCDVAETCDGSTNACPANAFQPSTFVCRAAAGECDAAETCTGSSATCPATDAKKPNNTACTDDGNVCTTDVCNGTANTCQHPPGNGGTVCRASAGECDVEEKCTGSSATCPATDAKKANNTACTDDGNVCTKDVCNGSSVACQHPAGNSGTVCRASAGECDAQEVCDGSATTCPADAKKANNTACTSDGNACTKDVCDGSSVECQHPAGNAGTVCRGSAGACDAAETCDGASTSCPADAKHPSGYECRAASANGCDVAETCDGTADACPANAFAAEGVVCRAKAGECDVEETCGGGSDLCPLDGVVTIGTPCTDDGNVCTKDLCNGLKTCDHSVPALATTVCRTSAGECDRAETCGGMTVCPPDGFEPNNSSCSGGLKCCNGACCLASGDTCGETSCK